MLAASVEETKQILSGVHLSVSQDTLEFAATDGHRLAVVQTANENLAENGGGFTDGVPPSDPRFSKRAENRPVFTDGVSPLGGEFSKRDDVPELEVTIPARAMRELERMLGMLPADESLYLNFERGQIVFEWGDHRLTSRTLEGQYPAYRQLIPRQFEREVTLDRRQLLSALERIAVLADQKNNIVKFSIDSDRQELALSVNAQDVGNGRELLSAQISGESIDIAFNIKYLMDGIKAIGTSEIQMQLNAALSPVILTPVGGLKMTYLIMPVQIRG